MGMKMVHQCVCGYLKSYPAVLCSLHKDPPEDQNMPEDLVKAYNQSLREWHKQCFMAKYVAGELGADDVDDAIDDWHMSKEKEVDVALHIYLGMSEPEYELFVKSPEEGIKSSAERWARVKENGRF